MTKYANWNLLTPFDGPTRHELPEVDLFITRRFRAECARTMDVHRRGRVYRFTSEYIHSFYEATGRFFRHESDFVAPEGYVGEWSMTPCSRMRGFDLEFSGPPLIPRFVVADVNRRLRYILDWAVSLDAHTLSKLPRMTFSSAYRRAEDWHRRIARRNEAEQSRALRDLGIVAVGLDRVPVFSAPILDFDPAAIYAPGDMVRWQGRVYFGRDVIKIKELEALPSEPVGEGERLDLLAGWYWARLVTRDALRQESQRMGHCVGHGAYDNLVASDFPRGIWSLRRGNESVATVEVGGSMIPGGNRVRQAKGPHNRALPEPARLRLKELRDKYDIEANGESLTRAEIKEIYGECHPLGIVPTPDADVDDACGIGGL
jgi:hypothetical protein